MSSWTEQNFAIRQICIASVGPSRISVVGTSRLPVGNALQFKSKLRQSAAVLQLVNILLIDKHPWLRRLWLRKIITCDGYLYISIFQTIEHVQYQSILMRTGWTSLALFKARWSFVWLRIESWKQSWWLRNCSQWIDASIAVTLTQFTESENLLSYCHALWSCLPPALDCKHLWSAAAMIFSLQSHWSLVEVIQNRSDHCWIH